MALKYKETSKSKSGAASIKFNKAKTKAKVSFLDGSFEKVFALDDFPEHPDALKLKDDDYSVAISGDESEVWRVSPVKGSYVAKVVDFNREEGAAPEPKTFSGMYGDFQMFGVIFEIQKGNLKGARLLSMIPYLFAEMDNGNLGIAGNPDTSKFARSLAEFADVTGIPEDLSYEDAPLPTLMDIVVSKGKLVRINIDNVGKNAGKGYIGSYIAHDEDETDDFPDVDKAFPKDEKKEEEVDTSLDGDDEDW